MRFPFSSKSDSFLEDLRQTCIAGLPVAMPFLPKEKSSADVGILMYHRVAPRRSNWSFPTSNVTPERFYEQLSGLLKRGFVAKPLETLLEWHRNGIAPEPNVFAVTFDDGYANNFTNALPILQKLKIPATIFVATAYLDSDVPFPFENWKLAGRSESNAEDWRALTSDECKALLDSGIISLGAHTHTHQDFRNRPSDFEQDLNLCIQILREKFRLTDVNFAFPFGKQKKGFSGPELVAAASRTGVKCGLTSENEMTNILDDPFHWGRWTASEYDSASALASKLNGQYTALKNFWKRTKAFQN